MNQKSPILITGTSGFIGFHLARRLLEEGNEIIGIDNINDYYEVELKESRNGILKNIEGYIFYKESLENADAINKIFLEHKPEVVINLAAQAGVRYSLTNPHAYINSNIVGFLNILEASRHQKVEHLIYASSSSVYGANTKMPFSVENNVDHPLSLYAATKKSNELMAHTYASSYGIPVTGLRFFTVYGPWGRPDMALFLFTKAIVNDEPIDVFNHGKMCRDFTYIDDIVEGILRLIDHKPKKRPDWDSNNPDPSLSYAPYQLFNIGSNNPVSLIEYISAIEEKLGKKAKKNFLPIQTGDVPDTHADVKSLEKAVGYKPSTNLKDGVSRFIDWYLDYYKNGSGHS